MFVRYAAGFVVHPGGFGTLDELFEALTLVQTQEVHEFPIVLVGRGHWTGLVDWVRERLFGHHHIDADDSHLLRLTDDAAEVGDILTAHHARGLEA